MTLLGNFSPSISAIRSNAKSYDVIGENIANSRTPGYKAGSTRFAEQIAGKSDGARGSFGGVKPILQRFIDQAGQVSSSNGPLDIAIQGKGFFVTNADISGGDEFQFTRSGQFGLTMLDTSGTEETYITDISGQFVFGWPADSDGASFTTGSGVESLVAMQIDETANVYEPDATTTALYDANLAADAATGSTFASKIGVFDEAGNENAMKLTFTKAGTNTWDLDIEVANSDLTTGVVPTTALTFDASGNLTSDTTTDITPTFTDPDGGSSTITLDISGLTQYAGNNTVRRITRNGNVEGSLQSISFNQDGIISGNFSNGESKSLYKLPVTVVTSPNLMDLRTHTHYALSTKSGDAELYEADATDQGSFIPGSLEESTTSMELEFSRLIENQHAYSSNVRAFTVAEEMTRTATNLKQ